MQNYKVEFKCDEKVIVEMIVKSEPTMWGALQQAERLYRDLLWNRSITATVKML